jgi:hypothetical protein
MLVVYVPLELAVQGEEQEACGKYYWIASRPLSLSLSEEGNMDYPG